MDDSEYTIIDGIKVLSGNTKSDRIRYIKNTEFHRDKYYADAVARGRHVNDVFDKLKMESLSVKGQFTKVQFVEEELIKRLHTPKNPQIIMINCNYGEIVHPSPAVVFKESELRSKKYMERNSTNTKKSRTSATSNASANSRTSQRQSHNPLLINEVTMNEDEIKLLPRRSMGRKVRKQQGNGFYFNNQITFIIANINNKKAYKIKLFRTGLFQVPHTREQDMSDVTCLLIILRDYLREELADPTIEIEYMISNTLNFSCNLLLLKRYVFQNLHKMSELLCDFKKEEDVGVEAATYLSNIKARWRPDIVKQFCVTEYSMNIVDIQYNCERITNLIITLKRPRPWNPTKEAKIVINIGGKVNITNCNSVEEATEVYWWLASFYLSRFAEIIIDDDSDDERYVENDSYDDGGNESEYDP